MRSGRYDAAPLPSAPIAFDPFWSTNPAERLAAARAMSPRARRRAQRAVDGWPPYSPGAVNAWLLFVTTKPPWWKDPLLEWRELPLTVGEPHEGFLYPDPLGFWAEVRRWTAELLGRHNPTWGTPEVLSLAALVHVEGEPSRVERARQQCRPSTVVFLDEPAWRAANLDVRHEPHRIPDPHRAGVVYEGFWGVAPDGTVVGKAPQHPSTHRLYRATDMSAYLRSAPVPSDERLN